jgi:hypothetical protein
MRTLALTLASVTPLFLGAAYRESPDDAAVRAAIDHYFQGHATGDGNHFRAVFHPESKLFAIRDGKFWQLASADYAARASGKPPADEAKRKRYIESVDVTGDAAIVKVILDYPTTKFTDYMSMLRVDGKWMIVNKTFAAETK